MADFEVIEKYSKSQRLDHANFCVVHDVTFAKGTIVDMGIETMDPITFDDTCSVEIGGSTYPNIPLFYHCRLDPTHSEFRVPVGSTGSIVPLKGAALAFAWGDEVKVMLSQGVPVAVVGQMNEPLLRECLTFAGIYFSHLGPWPTGVPLPGGHHPDDGWVTIDLISFDRYAEELSYISPCNLPMEYRTEKLTSNVRPTEVVNNHYSVLGPAIYLISAIAGGSDLDFWQYCEAYAAVYTDELWSQILALADDDITIPDEFIAQGSLADLLNTEMAGECTQTAENSCTSTSDPILFVTQKQTLNRVPYDTMG